MLAARRPGIGEQALDEYFKAYADPVRRRGQLELYRSGDFAELEPYRAGWPRSACRRCCSSAPRTRSRGRHRPPPRRGDPARASWRSSRHRALHVRRGPGSRPAGIVVDFLGVPGAGWSNCAASPYRPLRRDHLCEVLRRLAWAAVARLCVSSVQPPPRLGRRTVPKLNWQAVRRARATSSARRPRCRSTTTGRTAASIKLVRRQVARADQAHRSARCSSTSAAPAARPPTTRGRRRRRSSRRSTSATTSSGWTRAASARASPRSTARPTRRRRASTRSRSRRPTTSTPRALIAQGPALHRPLRRAQPARSCRTSRRRTWRATSTCCARPLGEQQDQRTSATPTGRSWARRTRACSRRTTARMVLDGPVDADRLHQRPPGRPERAERRLRARARALLPGLRRRPGRVPRLRRRRPVGRVRPADRAGSTPSRSRPAGRRPAPGRRRRHHRRRGDRRSTPRATGRTWPRRWPRRGNGDGTLLRILVDGFYGRYDDGTYDPGSDRYFTIGATEQHYPRDVRPLLRARASARGPSTSTRGGTTATSSSTTGCGRRDRDAFAGRSRSRTRRSTPLVVATTYDPATPYRGAKNLVRDLGNARLLTHARRRPHGVPGQLGLHRPAVEAYVNTVTLPAAGHTCRQDVGIPGAGRPPCSRWPVAADRGRAAPAAREAAGVVPLIARRARRGAPRRGGPALTASASPV